MILCLSFYLSLFIYLYIYTVVPVASFQLVPSLQIGLLRVVSNIIAPTPWLDAVGLVPVVYDWGKISPIPFNTPFFNTLKVNIGLTLVGVISGEFLVSKGGLGYLIVYGGQVFQLDLVMTSVIILAFLAALMYESIVIIEKLVIKYN